MTAPPATVAEFDALLAKAKDAGVLPIMQWNATASGGGLAFPLQNLMAAYGPTRADQRLDLPEAGRDDRHADEPQAAEHLQRGSRPATSPRTPTRSSTPTRTPLRRGRRRVHLQRRLGERRLRQGHGRQRRLLPLPAARAGGTVAAMSAPLTYGIAANAANAGLRRVLLQLGGDQRDGPPDQRRRRRLEPRRSRPIWRSRRRPRAR